MLHDPVRDTQYSYRRGIRMSGLEFQDSRTESTDYCAVFDSDDPVIPRKDLMQHFFVQRLYKAHIVMCRIQPIHPQFPDRRRSEITRMPDRQDGNAFAVLQLATLADRNF